VFSAKMPRSCLGEICSLVLLVSQSGRGGGLDTVQRADRGTHQLTLGASVLLYWSGGMKSWGREGLAGTSDGHLPDTDKVVTVPGEESLTVR